MKILLVYEEVPEDTHVYVLENVSEIDWAWMKLTHHQYINARMPSREVAVACDKLKEYIEGLEAVEADSPILIRSQNFDYFLHSGFIL